MATAPKFLPLNQPIATPERYCDRTWALYFQSLIDQAAAAGTVTATGTLTLNELVVGNGGTDLKSLGSAGTTTTVLHGNAPGLPSFGAVVLTTDVSGRLPLANLAQGTGLSVLGVTGNATADEASIVAGSDAQVLRRNGTSVTFGAVDLSATAAVTNRLALANLAQGTALSVLGVTGNATADEASIVAASDAQVLRRSGTSVGFGAVDLASANAVTGNLAVTHLNSGTNASSATFWRGDGVWETAGGAYVPVSTGAEPLVIVSNGAGAVLLVPYTP